MNMVRRNIVLSSVLLSGSLSLVYYIYYTTSEKPPAQAFVDTTDSNGLQDPLYNELIHKQKQMAKDSRSCPIPILNPYDPMIQPFYERITPHDCSNEALPPVTFIHDETYIRINDSAAQTYYPAGITEHCFVQYFTWSKETRAANFTERIALQSGAGIKLPDDVQYIYTCCGRTAWYSNNGQAQCYEYFYYHYRYVETPTIASKLKAQRAEKRQGLSVLLFITDEVSHSQARRYLPKTYYYLYNKLGGVPMNGFHGVMSNTFYNMLPHIAGMSIEEYGWGPNNPPIDQLPFIWKEFDAKNIITGYFEDSGFSTFEYLREGFSKQPTDYYDRLYSTVAEGQASGKCIRERGEASLVLDDLLTPFLRRHKSDQYHYWYHLNSYSHGENNRKYIQYLDDIYYEFFSRNYNEGNFENTLIMFASDHGPRFGDLRTTPVGTMEHSLPLMMFVLPSKFKQKHPQLYSIIQANGNKLVTHFDIHETLHDIANNIFEVRHHGRNSSGQLQRGLSVFGEIPDSRICEEAGIKTSLCVCNERVPLHVRDSLVTQALSFTIGQHINQDKLSKLPQCAKLEVDTVLHAFQVIERINEYTEAARKQKLYTDVTVTFTTKPGGGLYESHVQINMNDYAMQVMYPFYRMNMYYNTADCVKDPNLREYCYCKSNIKQVVESLTWSGVDILVLVLVISLCILITLRFYRRCK